MCVCVCVRACVYGCVRVRVTGTDVIGSLVLAIFNLQNMAGPEAGDAPVIKVL